MRVLLGVAVGVVAGVALVCGRMSVSLPVEAAAEGRGHGSGVPDGGGVFWREKGAILFFRAVRSGP